MKPANDGAFRLWLSGCIETFREVNLIDKDPLASLCFRSRMLRLSKRLALSRTCKLLESPLYFSKS